MYQGYNSESYGDILADQHHVRASCLTANERQTLSLQKRWRVSKNRLDNRLFMSHVSESYRDQNLAENKFYDH